VQAPREVKSNDSKDSFYEELEQVFEHFPKNQIKALLGDFNAKVEREDILKPKVWNENLHQDNNDNGVRTLNFATVVSCAVLVGNVSWILF
jgi:exonuclease III